MTFEIASAVERTGDFTYGCEIPEGWLQGRGAFGGLVLGVLLRAIEESEADKGRRTRTLLGDIAAPVVAGPAQIEVTVLRRGANQSNLRADLKRNGEILAYASAVLSTPRKVGFADLRPRVVPAAREGGLLLPHDSPIAPPFTKQLAMTVVKGLPLTAQKEPEVEAWIRTHEAPSKVDGPLLVAYLDSYWPSLWATVSSPRPTATISFAAQFLRDPATLDPNAHYFYRARMQSDDEGFELEYRDLFDANGEIVASNQQTFAVIK